ncbi:receptor-type tyrosine-protein phosphatase F-like [Leucoraja erinacea]|uniref:receptor-type tyrosine-protein phosphatase F-like n=1 Tax=Leucoraja erinaceus TaxID=7782 RepID=UPI002457D2AA|nr:receptor-type tyrosine-protein phosphatase F-like [Leucoraja erinacea]
MAKIVSSLLIIVLLIGLLVFLAHRRWGHKLQRPREQVFTPLIRTRPGVSTEVRVSKLLDAMVKMQLFNDNSDDEDGDDGMTMEYRNLSNYPLHSCSVGQDPHNASKSRYHTILPYDNSRVVLRDGNSCDGFINASYIDGYRKPNYYIATQGPLAETVADFWSMVWQEHCNLIVMLTRLNEQGKPKCERYCPKRGSETFGQFTVTRVSETSPATQEFTSSTLRLQKVDAVDGSSREVQHLHYLQWPDHGVPSNTISIYRMLKHIHQSSHNTRHMLVHCSALGGVVWRQGRGRDRIRLWRSPVWKSPLWRPQYGAQNRDSQRGGPQLGGAQFGGPQCGGAQCGGAQCGGAQCGGAQCGGAQCEVPQCGGAQCGGAQCGGPQCGGAQCGGAQREGLSMQVMTRVSDHWQCRCGADRNLHRHRLPAEDGGGGGKVGRVPLRGPHERTEIWHGADTGAVPFHLPGVVGRAGVWGHGHSSGTLPRLCEQPADGGTRTAQRRLQTRV